MLLHAPEHASPSYGQQLDPVYAKQATANQGHFIYHRCGSGTLTETTLQHVELTPTMGRQYRCVCTFERQQPYAEPEAAQKDRNASGPAIEHSSQRNGTSASCAELHFRSVAYHFIYAETLLRVSGSGGKHFSLYYAVPLARELYYERVAQLAKCTGRYGTPFMRTKHTFSLRLHILQPIWRNILRCGL